MSIFSKLKNFFTIKIVEVEVKPCTAPAPCPKCGAGIEVPLTRNPMQKICHVCNTTITTMAIGLVDANEDRLKYIREEVIMWINVAHVEYNAEQKKLH